MENFESTLAVIAAIGAGLSGPVAALVEAIKSTGYVPSRFLSLLSLLVGTVSGAIFGLVFPGIATLGAFAFGGFSAGMAASALYDNVTRDKITVMQEEEEIK